MVVDADALNILSAHPDLLALLPPYSILTPHPKEFERLFGPSPDDFARMEKAREQARVHQCVIVPQGALYFCGHARG
jgi:NAD(P)H-hydrate repair Nnr-like enzyme with NAD(P)H-hydrate dehydratase domain